MENEFDVKKETGNIYSLHEFNKKNKKLYLFHDVEEDVNYSLYTDGNTKHLRTWIDKRPYQLDDFLTGCKTVKRLEFEVTEANILIIEKKYKNKFIRNLYVNEEDLYKIATTNMYHLVITDDSNVMVKRLKRF